MASKVKYILLLLLVSYTAKAQLAVKGLAGYIIGISTVDSVSTIDFVEEDQSDGRGVQNLPCPRVRVFKAVSISAADIGISDVSLKFLDNTLYEISCDYSDELKDAFIVKYGKGVTKRKSYFPFCTKKGKQTLIWGESWKNGDILTLAVHTKGYNGDCEYEEDNRLTISSEKLAVLGNECIAKNYQQSSEEFDRQLEAYKAQLRKEERDRIDRIRKEL